MRKERKILPVVKKIIFKEAEDADDKYWANATAEERLQELIRLRREVYGDLIDQPIKKVVFKRKIKDIENQI